MKRLEGEPQQRKAPLSESAKSVFLEAQKKHPHDLAKQVELIVAAHRPAGLPENFQPLGMADHDNREQSQQRGKREEAGNKDTPLYYWQQIQIERQKKEQEARERIRIREQSEQKLAQEQREKQEKERLKIEQKRKREEEKGTQRVKKLEAEAENKGIYLFGSQIKSELESILTLPINLNKFTHPHVTEQDDGTYIDRSQIGMELSYQYQPRVSYTVEVTETTSTWDGYYETISYETRDKIVDAENRLSFGIGYFTDRSHIAPEARTSVSDEDLKRGMKAYFIEHVTVMDKELKRETYVIPEKYPESDHLFVKYLNKNTEAISSNILLKLPEKIVKPEALKLAKELQTDKEKIRAKSNSQLSKEYTEKGVELLMLGKYDEAFLMYERAIAANPNNGSAWTNKGYLLYKYGRYEEAEQAYKKGQPYIDAIKQSIKDMQEKHNKEMREKWNKRN